VEHKSLSQVASEHPYPDFAEWWPVGDLFSGFMASAIGAQWQAIAGNAGDLTTVQQDVVTYIDIVYQRAARSTLAADFLAGYNLHQLQSGEFDALSYAFYKSAFTLFAAGTVDEAHVRQQRHRFTQRVGRQFYDQLHEHLELALPQRLAEAQAFAQLQQAISHVGQFLQQQGYLRDHFAFRFDVDVQRGSERIVQRTEDVVHALTHGKSVYALYEMGYPIILPSAVYLYQTMGEAQHHSSRTIEELFGRMNLRASETADFDPTGYPSEMVVELWEIQLNQSPGP